MPNKMLIDATHPEETRVVVLRGHRVEEFDFESANRKQLRGNIYLAKVTRVEPSLQAAFVDYGGNRHGFLAFSEIHPDYYQIPVADRQALIAEEERAHRDAEAEVDRRAGGRRRPRHRGAERPQQRIASEPIEADAGEQPTVEFPEEQPEAVTEETALTGESVHDTAEERPPAEMVGTPPFEPEQATISDAPGLVGDHEEHHTADVPATTEGAASTGNG